MKIASFMLPAMGGLPLHQGGLPLHQTPLEIRQNNGQWRSPQMTVRCLVEVAKKADRVSTATLPDGIRDDRATVLKLEIP